MKIELTAAQKTAFDSYLDEAMKGRFEEHARKGTPEGIVAMLGGSQPTQKSKRFTNDKIALRFGHWGLATIYGSETSAKWCKTNGIKLVKSQTEGTPSAGGYLVPEEFVPELIELRLQYGVARRNAKVVNMKSDVQNVPIRLGGVQAEWVGEGETADTSSASYGNLQLVINKLSVMVRYSNELDQDNVISVADDLAEQAVEAVEFALDSAVFVGDGTSTHGGISGITKVLKTLYGTGGGKGLILGSGNAYSELTMADFVKVKAALPSYAGLNAKWYVNPTFWTLVMEPMLLAAGGTSVADIANGVPEKFLGKPVEFVEVMPETAANSQVCAILGDLSRTVRIGDRGQMTALPNPYGSAFAADAIDVRYVDRVTAKCHSYGTADKAGAMVGLITAAS